MFKYEKHLPNIATGIKRKQKYNYLSTNRHIHVYYDYLKKKKASKKHTCLDRGINGPLGKKKNGYLMFTTYFYVNSGAYMQSNWVVTASRVESLEHLFGMA